ncbi:MAG: PAS domain-containing protein, partial [Kordiimonadaceae bacterium]|nr:PAS domain-containing protein [Kordiimonadaceae bacterium]
MTVTVTFLENLPDIAEISELHDYWKTICGDNAVPDRKDFSPVSVKKHLPNLAILEVDIAAEAFEVRLFGTALMELFGEDRTGRTQDNLTDKYEEGALEQNA